METKCYAVSDLQVKKLMIIGRLLVPILKRENSPLILLEQKRDRAVGLEDVKDHPYKVEVLKCGSGIEEYFPEGICEGDVLYIDRHFGDGDFMNYNGELYVKVLVHNVVSVLPKGKFPCHLRRYSEELRDKKIKGSKLLN